MFIHRGLLKPHFKENHLSSFKACIKDKFNLEVDIHFSQNDTPVCIHDYNLKRFWNVQKPIRSLLDQHLKQYNITKLSELLKIITHQTKLLVEIKPVLNTNTLNRLLETCHGFHSSVHFISFKENNLIKIRKITQDFKLGLIFHHHSQHQKIQQALNQKHIHFFVLPAAGLFNSKIKKIRKKKYFYTIKNIKNMCARPNYIVENVIN